MGLDHVPELTLAKNQKKFQLVMYWFCRFFDITQVTILNAMLSTHTTSYYYMNTESMSQNWFRQKIGK